MILFELIGSEENEVYQQVEIANGNRQYDFLRTVVLASLQIGRPFLSQQIIKALNFHAIACLHTNAGEYRPCQVFVGSHEPPGQHKVPALMDDFVNQVNWHWQDIDPVYLAAHVLWRLNYIHPFINGNGRTARAAAYFVLCLKLGGWLKGEIILPELIRRNRPEYVKALQEADASLAHGSVNLETLHALLVRLLEEQMATAEA